MCKVGVDERASRLIELALRRRGLRDGALPFGDDVGLFRCPSLLGEGEAGCGDGGRAVDEAALIERCFSACESEASLLFIDGGKGASEVVSLTTPFCDGCPIARSSADELVLSGHS